MPQPGRGRPKKETPEQFAARVAKQMRAEAARLKKEIMKLENSASVLDGKK